MNLSLKYFNPADIKDESICFLIGHRGESYINKS